MPGVKCKRTNGFNTDGSLNSIDTTFTRVTIPTFDTEVGRTLYFISSDNTAISNFVSGNVYVYDKSINNFITRDTKEVRSLCFAYSVTKDSTGRITSLTPNTTFHAVDYSEYSREVGRCAKLDEDNNFTGKCTFLNSRTLFKTDGRGSEGGEFTIEIPDSQKEVLGDVWSFDVFRNGDVRIFRAGGSHSMTLFTFSATSGVINYREDRTLALSDNSGNVPDTKWINSKFQK